MSATGTTGGTITVTGRDIVLRGATLDASGDLGGGTVLIMAIGRAGLTS